MKTNQISLVVLFMFFIGSINLAAQTLKNSHLTPPAQDYVLRFTHYKVAKAPDNSVLNLGNDFTMEAWIFPQQYLDAQIICRSIKAQVNISYALRLSEGGSKPEFVMTLGTFDVYSNIFSIDSIPLNSWTHLAGTLSGGIMKLYVNGIMIGSRDFSETPLNSTIPLSVGNGLNADGTTVFDSFQGAISQIRLWNRALSINEIQNQAGIYLKGNEVGLIAYWPCDDGKGRTAKDLTQNHLDLIFWGNYQFQVLDPRWVLKDVLDNGPYFKVIRNLLTEPTPHPNLGIFFDMFNDGTMDFLAAQAILPFDSTKLILLINDGKGNFTERNDLIINRDHMFNSGARQMLSDDYNNDGLADIFIADQGRDDGPPLGGISMLILQTADGRLECHKKDKIPYRWAYTHSAASGDIDDDGDIDMYMGRVGCENWKSPELYFNDGNANFTPNVSHLPVFLQTSQRIFNRSLFVDLNKDGYLDLLLGGGGKLNDAILWNDGTGDFTETNENALPPRAGGINAATNALASADLNNDGWPDLLMGTTIGSNQTWIQLFINNQDGTFRDESYNVSQPDPTWPGWVYGFNAVDLNKDGWIDFTSMQPEEPILYMNKGNGVFVNLSELLPVQRDFSKARDFIFTEDLDNDKDVDFFFTNGSKLYFTAFNLKPYDLYTPKVTVPGKTSIVSPAQMTVTSRSPVFEWNPLEKTNTVHIQIAADISFNNLVYDKKGITALHKYKVNLKDSGIFYWRICSGNNIGEGAWSEAAIFVAENQAPVNISMSGTKISELAAIGSTVGIFSTEDPDKLDTHTYIFALGNGINDADNSKFIIIGDTLKTKTINNSNALSDLHINIMSKDSSGAHVTKAFIITVEPEGLIAFYPFNGNAKDESGNNHNGTPTGATLTTDQYGNTNSSYYFNGTNSKILIGNHLGLIQSSPGFTITAWVYPEELLSGPQYTVIAEREGAENYQFELIDQRIRFDFWSGGVPHNFASADQLIPNHWYFIGVTYDGTTVSIYKDGLMNSSYTSTSPIDHNPSNLLIGQIYSNSGVFKGKLDEISIYNKALTPEKIKNLYSCSAAKGGNVNGNVTLCPETSTGILTLSGNVGNVIEWQKKLDNGLWGSIPSTSMSYSEIPGSSGTYYYRTVSQYGTCDIKYSEPATVNVVALDLGVSQANNVLTANAASATYQWLNCSTHEPIAGQTSRSYAATANGSYAVKITKNGCTDTSQCVSLANPFPDSARAISGVTSVCQGQNPVIYTVPAIANATSYIWTLPTGATGASSTNSISVNFGASAVSGNITVKGRNSTGDGAVSTLAIAVNKVYNIMENISICNGQNYQGWTTSGTYKRTLRSKTECDSVVATNLSLYPVYLPKVDVKGDTLKSADTYTAYQWYNDAGKITGATSKNYIIPKSGKYYLTVTDGNGCTNSSSVISMIYSEVKMSEFEDFRYSIIPNPNTGKFTFRIDANPPGEFVLRFINPVGQIIESRFVKFAAINHAEQFYVSDLSKGIYLLIISSNQKFACEKIVVQ